ncbi:MAG: alkaline phosphatase family protein [Dokdonella sp.]
MKRLVLTVLSGSLVMAVCVAQAAVPMFDHVLIIVMENHSYAEIIGSPSAPYINALAAAGVNFTQSFAVTHPSEPNYLAMFSGSTQGVSGDPCPLSFPGATNIAAQLIAAGHTFVGYSEGLPAAGSTVCSSGFYARKHSPWINFDTVPAASNQPLTAFPSDYATLPTLSYVIPDLCNDMHNCSIATGDSWLQTNLGGYATWAKTHNSLLILTWDEDDASAGNNIVTIFAGANLIPGSYAEVTGHYRMLATLEAMYGLAPLGGAIGLTPITDIWSEKVFANGFDSPPPVGEPNGR